MQRDRERTRFSACNKHVTTPEKTQYFQRLALLKALISITKEIISIIEFRLSKRFKTLAIAGVFCYTYCFTKPENTELLSVSIAGMKLFSLSYLTGWVDMCFSSYFTALERPVRSLITSFFGTLVFPIAFLFALTPLWKLNGVWLASVAACTASAILTIILALTMKTKRDKP